MRRAYLSATRCCRKRWRERCDCWRARRSGTGCERDSGWALKNIVAKSPQVTRRHKLLSRLHRRGSEVGSRDSDSPDVIPLVSQQPAMQLPLTFDSWDCKLPPLPTRSRLYSLQPIGMGTPFVESLSGYGARLPGAP